MSNVTRGNQGSAGAKILIVDDDAHSRDILSRWLTREGYSPVVAAGGRECLELVAAQDVDVILLDVMMPEMDGLQVCEKLAQNPAWRSIPIILLTAKDDLETRGRGMVLGVSEYVTKPVNKQELLARLKAQAHSRRLQRQLAATVDSFDKGPPK